MGYYAMDSGPPAVPRKTVGRILEETQGWSLFRRSSPEARPATEGCPRLATAVLLLEVAHADGGLSAGERRYIEWVLCREFGLDREDSERLLRAADAARAGSAGPDPFVDEIVRRLSRRQRRDLARMLEELAHVNRAPTREQEYAVRKISNLLRLEHDGV